MTVTHAIYALVCSVGFIFLALRLWHSMSNPESVEGVPGFRPSIGFSALDGMQSISLVLENESTARIWVEEIEISLAGLVANNQAAEPRCRETLRIRQVAEPGDTLPISLAGVVYKAAGEPQREHSSTLSSVLRFRIREEWFERRLEDYRIEMVGLTASEIRRERRRTRRAAAEPPHAIPESIAAVAAKLK